MKKNYHLLSVGVIALVLTNCSKDNDTVTVQDADINFSFDYTKKDSRLRLGQAQFTSEEIAEAEKAFATTLANAQGARNKTVAAATFLVSMKYAIPYAHRYYMSDGIYDYVGRYTKKGLFLNEIKDANGTHKPWGKLVPTHPKFDRSQVKGLGDNYENGLNCSSFVTWALYNGGAVEGIDVNTLNKYIAANYPEFPNAYTVTLKQGIDNIRVGDLIGFNKAHIAMVIGVKGNHIIYASAEGGSVHPGEGLRYRYFDKQTTNLDTFTYKYIVKMEKVYND
ncbi:hypothetical protein RCZ04_22270 [Capnocytophaga sp. HP1101]